MTAQASEAAVRVALAAATTSTGQAWWGQALQDWVLLLEPVLDGIDGFDVAADVDLTRLWCRADGPVDVVLSRAQRWFQHTGTASDGVDAAGRAQALGASEAGCWVSFDADALATGWDVGGPFSASAVLGGLGDGWAANRLRRWADEERAETVLRVGAPSGVDDAAEVLLALPGADVDRQLGAALSLFGALEVAPLPDVLLGALGELGRPRLAARVALTPTGVAELGVLSRDPTTELVLYLAGTAQAANDDALAAFQGTLGVETPEWVELAQRGVSEASGPQVVVRYRLR